MMRLGVIVVSYTPHERMRASMPLTRPAATQGGDMFMADAGYVMNGILLITIFPRPAGAADVAMPRLPSPPCPYLILEL